VITLNYGLKISRGENYSPIKMNCDHPDANCNQPSVASIRFIHNVYGAPNVNIYLNDKPVALNLSYKDITGYLTVRSGDKKLIVKLSGTDTVLVSESIVLPKNSSTTSIILGDVKDLATIKAMLYRDDLKCPKPGNAHLRFIHGAFGAPAVDVYANNTKIFSDVKYTKTGIPTYLPVQVGKVSIPGGNPYLVIVEVKVAGTNTVVVGPLSLYLISGGIYTAVASGTVTDGLTALFSQDNLNKCEELQKNFNAQSYMGKWYQIANIPQFFDRNCDRSTAEYTLLSDSVNVFNTCYDKNWKVIETITGSAVAPNPCQPAALQVSFPTGATGIPVTIFGPNYLVHKTDYINYAVVGSPTRTTFYILSRKSKMCLTTYNKLIKYAVSLGYDKDSIVQNYHSVSNDC
jgi:apolipoprotein D and lipocalin family protein